jgi:hypothetical protein
MSEGGLLTWVTEASDTAQTTVLQETHGFERLWQVPLAKLEFIRHFEVANFFKQVKSFTINAYIKYDVIYKNDLGVQKWNYKKKKIITEWELIEQILYA